MDSIFDKTGPRAAPRIRASAERMRYVSNCELRTGNVLQVRFLVITVCSEVIETLEQVKVKSRGIGGVIGRNVIDETRT